MLCLYNTLTRKADLFKPLEDMLVKMYTCGPSTYQRAHIGNYRTFLYEDILQRYLEYLGYTVTRLITLTDVEDKAISEAKKEWLSVAELTQRNEAKFFRDFELLKIKVPDHTVRASNVVNQSVALIKTLMKKGYAYRYPHEDVENVYFDPLKFGGFGKLRPSGHEQMATQEAPLPHRHLPRFTMEQRRLRFVAWLQERRKRVLGHGNRYGQTSVEHSRRRYGYQTLRLRY